MPSSKRIPFEGVLNCWNDEHDLPDLLLSVSRSGRTGRLHFSNPEGDKILYFAAGKITFAESSSQDDGLGQYLLRTGRISLMDYVRVSRRVEPGKRLGTLLVEENVLDASELSPAVLDQVRSIILGLFRRTETWYAFKEQETAPKESIMMDLDVPAVILEGVRFVESWRRISKGVGNLESIYRSAAPEPAEKRIALDPDVQELLDIAEEPVSLETLCTRASLPDFEACRYLWALRSLGWIEQVEASELAITKPAAPAPRHEPEPVAQNPPVEPSREAPAPARPNTEPVVPPPAPPPIPERLIATQVAMDRLPSPASEIAAPPEPAPPPAIPEELTHTQMYITPPVAEAPPEPRPAEAPEPEAPLPDSLVKTQLPIAPPPEPKAVPIPEELMHTQMFVEPKPEAPKPDAAPDPPLVRSPGEMMESILEGEAPETAPPVEERRSTTDGSQTQFFEGATAIPEPKDVPAAPSRPEARPKPNAKDVPTLPSIDPPAPPKPTPPEDDSR